ncbi:MAG TPA: hypothetical protein VKE49_01740 [Myxococcaceae bacterium]|nr:hypothetical protein [Myxococcaceae bacterium]
MTRDEELSPAPPAQASGAARSPLQSPFCGELRSKKFYLLNRPATEADDYLDESDHCWCYVTQQVIGPDGRQVDPYRCTQGRACYRSAFAVAQS